MSLAFSFLSCLSWLRDGPGEIPRKVRFGIRLRAPASLTPAKRLKKRSLAKNASGFRLAARTPRKRLKLSPAGPIDLHPNSGAVGDPGTVRESVWESRSLPH